MKKFDEQTDELIVQLPVLPIHNTILLNEHGPPYICSEKFNMKIFSIRAI